MIEHLGSARLTSQKNISTEKNSAGRRVVGNHDFLLGG